MTRCFRIIATALTLIALAAGSVFAQPSSVDKFLFDEMLKLADKGQPEAEYHVGMFYNNGIGTEADPKQAFEWFKKSAEAGDPLGAYKLGCYYAGQFKGVVEIDQDLALKHKLVAAEQGYDVAQLDVARQHYDRKNYREAIRWWTEAAMQGEPSSLYHLSATYGQGEVVEADLAKSYLYLDAMRKLPEVAGDQQIAAVFESLAGMMSESQLKAAQSAQPLAIKPTALTEKARLGLSQAKLYLADNLN